MTSKSNTQPPRTYQRLAAYSAMPGIEVLVQAGVRDKQVNHRLPRSNAVRKAANELAGFDETYARAAAYELTSRLSTTSAAWGSTEVKPTARWDGSQIWSSTIDAATYKSSVCRLRTTSDSEEVEELRIQHDEPHLLFAFALGLHEDMEADAESVELTAAVIDTVVFASAQPAFGLKYQANVARPSDPVWSCGRDLTPLLPVPFHPAYPSGHAVTAAALAVVLDAVTRKKGSSNNKDLDDLARDIGYNRVRAGLHVKQDVDDGIALGVAVGEEFVRAAGDSQNFRLWSALFDAARSGWVHP